MIVVTARVHIPAASRERFLEVATTMCTRSRAEDGCIGYRVYEDLEQPERYVFVEEWASDDALARHFQQEHTAAFLSALGPLMGEAPDALFHEVAGTRRLDPQRGLVPVE
ncbi:MAG TPA: putative quinol monooxygenase [Solirubrobacteraceae bacterium]|nr:putative quinol monooxygenase [Solirubrobacteraceae bacterium]